MQAKLISMAMSLLAKIATEAVITEIMLQALGKLVKSTKNTLDDDMYEVISKALKR